MNNDNGAAEVAIPKIRMYAMGDKALQREQEISPNDLFGMCWDSPYESGMTVFRGQKPLLLVEKQNVQGVTLLSWDLNPELSRNEVAKAFVEEIHNWRMYVLAHPELRDSRLGKAKIHLHSNKRNLDENVAYDIDVNNPLATYDKIISSKEFNDEKLCLFVAESTSVDYMLGWPIGTEIGKKKVTVQCSNSFLPGVIYTKGIYNRTASFANPTDLSVLETTLLLENSHRVNAKSASEQ